MASSVAELRARSAYAIARAAVCTPPCAPPACRRVCRRANLGWQRVKAVWRCRGAVGRGRVGVHTRRSHQLPTHSTLFFCCRRSPSSRRHALERLRSLGTMSNYGRSTVQHPHLASPHCPKESGASPAENHVLPPLPASCRTSTAPHVGVRARHGGSCAASSASFFIWHPIAVHARLRGVAHATYLCKSP